MLACKGIFAKSSIYVYYITKRKKKSEPEAVRRGSGFLLFGAGGGGRTRTLLPGLDFESSTSANSITPASVVIITLFSKEVKRKN